MHSCLMPWFLLPTSMVLFARTDTVNAVDNDYLADHRDTAAGTTTMARDHMADRVATIGWDFSDDQLCVL